MDHPVYAVITPVRNEAAYLPKVIESLSRQTFRPKQWVIVDDGSTDRTGQIADEAARQHGWIRVVHRVDRGFRKSGRGVVEAFYDGLAVLGDDFPDFLVKLDGDLAFEDDYFEKCFLEFSRDPQLGIAGGTICLLEEGRSVVETPGDPSFHVRGATKIYRHACWRVIGGLIAAPGWDTIDEVKANMLGWRTCTFSHIRLIQQRATGRAEALWKDWVKNGQADYMTGYHPLFMMLKCVKRAIASPLSTAAPGLFCGFIRGYLQRLPRAAEPAVVRYIREQQIKRLMLRPSLWS